MRGLRFATAVLLVIALIAALGIARPLLAPFARGSAAPPEARQAEESSELADEEKPLPSTPVPKRPRKTIYPPLHALPF